MKQGERLFNAMCKGLKVVFDCNQDLGELLKQAKRKKMDEIAKQLETDDETPAGAVLTWHATPEQIRQINAGERSAVDKFYFDNYERLKMSAYRFMRNNAYLKAVISYEDLLNQIYVDLRSGVIRLRPFDKAIGLAVFTSYRYAPVGGYDEIYIYGLRELLKCQRTAN